MSYRAAGFRTADVKVKLHHVLPTTLSMATLYVLSTQYRTRSSDIALLRSLKQCSADREYTY